MLCELWPVTNQLLHVSAPSIHNSDLLTIQQSVNHNSSYLHHYQVPECELSEYQLSSVMPWYHQVCVIMSNVN